MKTRFFIIAAILAMALGCQKDNDQITVIDGTALKYSIVECKTESAWAEGTPYDKGWVTFTGYAFEEATVKLWGGPNNHVGYVHLSAPDIDDNVIITIELINGWELQNVDQPLNVQDYEYAPSLVGGIAKFTYKSATNKLNVKASNFYGIHVDVQKCL